jgi:protein-disulfide isomerase
VSADASPTAISVTEIPTARPSSLGSAPHYLYDADDQAQVTVVEFVDFQCPPCGRLAPIMSELAEEHPGAVNIAVRHFPLSMHANAVPAAVAAEAAAAQGSIAAMYTALFEQQELWASLSPVEAMNFFRGMVGTLGLDVAAWDLAIQHPDTLAAVQMDIDEGKKLGVQGTPSIFVNDTLTTFDTVKDLYDAIDDALKATKTH